MSKQQDYTKSIEELSKIRATLSSHEDRTSKEADEKEYAITCIENTMIAIASLMIITRDTCEA